MYTVCQIPWHGGTSTRGGILLVTVPTDAALAAPGSTRPEDDCADWLAAMKKRLRIGMLLASLALWACLGILPADDRFLWRSWGVRDGFTETYSYAVSGIRERTPMSATERYAR